MAPAVMAERYSFATHWQIEAPVGAVWDAIYHSEAWPEWWRGVRVMRVSEGDSSGTGAVMHFTWKGSLPYRLRFMMQLTERVEHTRLGGKAWGDVAGTGVWHFREENGITFVDYYWEVETRKRWMNRFAGVLRPVFRRNHDVVMRRGAKGLAKRLNAALIAY